MNDNNFYSEYNESNDDSRTLTVSETNMAFVKSYLWMFLGVFITFISGMVFSIFYRKVLLSNSRLDTTIFLILFIASFIVQMVLSHTINKTALVEANFKKALTGFLVFSILNGFSFSSLFVYFDVDILYQVFGIVSIYFLILTGISFLFRNKIQKMAGFALVGLITLLITSALVSLFSLFLFDASSSVGVGLYLAISILGLIVFTILTLVDIKSMHRIIDNSMHKNSASIAAAFSLYLDFINIFIYILRIVAMFSKNRKKD